MRKCAAAVSERYTLGVGVPGWDGCAALEHGTEGGTPRSIRVPRKSC